jgi:hypothetical protein
MGEPEGAGVIASQDRAACGAGRGVILTPDQRVFIFLDAGRARGHSVTVA